MTESEPDETIAGVVTSENGSLPFRYDARLANEIESRWQERWETEGTFHSPNPAGPLAAGAGIRG
jgi:leucyl-tRNA synthetase